MAEITLGSLQAEVQELRRELIRLRQHSLSHELPGDDTVRLSVQNSGTQLNRQRTLNAGTGITAIEDSANKRITLSTAGQVLEDADGDTKIQVEESPDEDIIRFDAAGTELMTVGHEGAVDIFHTAGAANEHALELDVDAAGYGDVLAFDIVYDTGAQAIGSDDAVILVNIDESAATGGDVAALEVLATEGSATIFALEVGAVVHPIEHLSGTFANMDSALVNAVDRLTEFTTSDPGGANNVEIFVANNDTVTIGDAAKFEEIEFLLETVASGAGIKPTFEYSTGAGPTWATFSPTDGTNGLRNTGVIAWLDTDIPSWAQAGGEYLIRITRTRVNLATVPKEDKAQIAAVVIFSWNKDGDIVANSLYAPRTRNLWLPAAAFVITGGAPTLAAVHGTRGSAWLLDADADEYVGAEIIVPKDWTSGTATAKIYYTMAGANTDDAVRFRVTHGSFADGESMASSSNADATVTVPDDADTLDVYTSAAAITVAANDIMQLVVARLGSFGGDGAAGDLQFLGLAIEYLGDM